MKVRSIAIGIGIVVAAASNAPAFAGANDFFGSSIGGSPDNTQGAAGASAVSPAAAAAPNLNAPAGDYTGDEKRVQKKFKENIKVAQKLVSKGETMMKSKEDKVSKKGKILKEIGEKRLAELKQNNPFPELASKEPKKIN